MFEFLFGKKQPTLEEIFDVDSEDAKAFAFLCNLRIGNVEDEPLVLVYDKDFNAIFGKHSLKHRIIKLCNYDYTKDFEEFLNNKWNFVESTVGEDGETLIEFSRPA